MNIKTIIKSVLTVIILTTVNLKPVVAQPADCISDIYTAEINETSLHYIECGEGDRSPEMFGLIHDQLEQCFPDVDRAVIPGASHGLKIQEPPVFSNLVLTHLLNLKMQSE